jgi:hypothetical protein
MAYLGFSVSICGHVGCDIQGQVGHSIVSLKFMKLHEKAGCKRTGGEWCL